MQKTWMHVEFQVLFVKSKAAETQHHSLYYAVSSSFHKIVATLQNFEKLENYYFKIFEHEFLSGRKCPVLASV